jgi:hypothetical protein
LTKAAKVWYDLLMITTDYIARYGIEALKDNLNIQISEYPDFWVLNYTQGISPKFDPVVKECRGLVVDKSLNVLARGFDRFFNYGEDPSAHLFDFNRAEVTEKLDGSLIYLWYNPYTSRWQASTRKMAFAEGPTGLGNRFNDVVERALGAEVHSVMQGYHPDLTYICELVSPETRVVTPYTDTALYLLAVRNAKTGIYQYGYSVPYPLRNPRRYEFSCFEDCMSSASALPEAEEGYVARVGEWRIKIKNPAYLALSKLRANGCLTTNRLVDLVWSGEYEEYLAYFPEDRGCFEPYIQSLKDLKRDVKMVFDAYGHLEYRKEFANVAKQFPFAGILFSLYDGCSEAEAFNKVSDSSKMKLLQKGNAV